MELEDLQTGEKVALGGAVLTLVAAFLPWVSAGFITVAGIDIDDGILTLLFGLAVGGIVLVRDWEDIDVIGTGILGALTVLIAGNILTSLNQQFGQASATVGAGSGLYLTIVGGIVIVAGAVLGYREGTSAGSGL